MHRLLRRPVLAGVLAGLIALAAVGCGAAASPKRAALAGSNAASIVGSNAASIAGGNAASIAAAGASGRTISATAVGTADGTPDLLTITIGVQTQAPSAKQALADNNTKARAVIDRLKAAGVADADVQTSQLNVSPVYTGTTTPTITAYQVSDLVTAKLRNLAGAGAVIDDAAGAAGNAARVEGIVFSIADDSALASAARAAAVRLAHARAKVMADAAGVQLGPLRSITDVALNQQPYPVRMAFDSAAAGGLSPSVPIQPGSEQLRVQVEVVYDIGS